MRLENIKRGGDGLMAVRAHRVLISGSDLGETGPQHIGDLLADLMHYCDAQGYHWDECHRIGIERYVRESTPEERADG